MVGRGRSLEAPSSRDQTADVCMVQERLKAEAAPRVRDATGERQRLPCQDCGTTTAHLARRAWAHLMLASNFFSSDHLCE